MLDAMQVRAAGRARKHEEKSTGPAALYCIGEEPKNGWLTFRSQNGCGKTDNEFPFSLHEYLTFQSQNDCGKSTVCIFAAERARQLARCFFVPVA